MENTFGAGKVKDSVLYPVNLKFQSNIQVIMSVGHLEVRPERMINNLGVSSIQMAPKAQHSL